MKRKIKDRMKKFLAEALVAGLLLVPAVLPPTGTVEESLPGELRLCPVGIWRMKKNWNGLPKRVTINILILWQNLHKGIFLRQRHSGDVPLIY